MGAPADTRERASSSAPRTSPGRRLRERFYRKQAEKRAAALAAQQASRGPRVKAPPAISVPTPLNTDVFLFCRE